MKSNGIRGPYGASLITEDCFYKLPFFLKQAFGLSHIAIAHDPRPSSSPLYQALVKGAKDAGLVVYAAGLLPTPMLSKWCFDHCVLGLIVTASHNPVSDNGLKIVGQTLSDELCAEIMTKHNLSQEKVAGGEVVSYHDQIKAYYTQVLLQEIGHITGDCWVDCANGAWSYHLDILERLGLNVKLMHPINPSAINATGCVKIQELSLKQPISLNELGVYFDGDGDRLNLQVSEGILDGDDILWHLASLESGSVVGTVMSNQVLVERLSEVSISCTRSPVGDQLVYKQMKANNARFGAEPCGHIIDQNWMPVSDPVYILCLLLLKVGRPSLVPLAGKNYQFHAVLPKTHDISVLRQKIQHPALRVVIRYSETEPVIRIMLEGSKEIVQSIVATSLSVE